MQSAAAVVSTTASSLVDEQALNVNAKTVAAEMAIIFLSFISYPFGFHNRPCDVYGPDLGVLEGSCLSPRLPSLARSSPGAPHRGGGLPFSEPGLKAETHDLRENLAEKLHRMPPVSSPAGQRKILFLNPKDNIAVCLADIDAGEKISQDGREVSAIEAIPRGHKISTADIAKGDGIIKYGERMGHATKSIATGSHVHTHNVLGDRLSTENS
ncbi:unannotated protein [freshwater metagenome]|uniref:Unannotated protein n=1 Tax=freshwater metagenome TaxID=449393 RepID=A0A6J7SFP8_9ZZZZ